MNNTKHKKQNTLHVKSPLKQNTTKQNNERTIEYAVCNKALARQLN